MIPKPKSVSESAWSTHAPTIGQALRDAWAVMAPTIASPDVSLLDMIRATYAASWLHDAAKPLPDSTDASVAAQARTSGGWDEEMRGQASTYSAEVLSRHKGASQSADQQAELAYFAKLLKADLDWIDEWPRQPWGKSAIAAARRATAQQPWGAKAVAAAAEAVRAQVAEPAAAAEPPVARKDTALPEQPPAQYEPPSGDRGGGYALASISLALGLMWLLSRKGKGR